MSVFYDDWIAFDVETIKETEEGTGYALQPWRAKYHQAKIRTFATSQIRDGRMKSVGYSKFDRHMLSKMLLEFAARDVTLVGWKVAFDIAWLCGMGLAEEASRCKWLDAMVVWKNLDRNRKSYSLKVAVAEFFPQHAGYGEGIDFGGDLDVLLAYNKKDTEFTLLLAIKFWSQLTDREQTALLIDMEDLPTIAERNVEGLYLDVAEVHKTAGFLHEQRTTNFDKIKPHLETIGQVLARGGEIKPKDIKDRFGFSFKDKALLETVCSEPAINLDSDKQLQKLLFEDWGLPIHKMTKGGKTGLNKKPSVDKESLIELSHIDERASWIQQYRETTGLISKCVRSVVASLKYNNPSPGHISPPIVRPEQNKSGTVTDRCTYGSYMDVKY